MYTKSGITLKSAVLVKLLDALTQGARQFVEILPHKQGSQATIKLCTPTCTFQFCIHKVVEIVYQSLRFEQN